MPLYCSFELAELISVIYSYRQLYSSNVHGHYQLTQIHFIDFLHDLNVIALLVDYTCF